MFKGLIRYVSSMVSLKSEDDLLMAMYRTGLSRKEIIMLERQTLKFDVAHMMLIEAFSLIASQTQSFQAVHRYLYKASLNKEEAEKIESLFRSTNARRDAFNFMVEMRDIKPRMLSACYPLGEKRNQFERWLDGKSDVL